MPRGVLQRYSGIPKHTVSMTTVFYRPVRINLEFAKRLSDYPWSSYPAYRNQSECPDWLYKESVFEELGSGQPTLAYGRFVEQGSDEETEKFYAKNHWPAVRGSERFADKAYLKSNAAS